MSTEEGTKETLLSENTIFGTNETSALSGVSSYTHTNMQRYVHYLDEMEEEEMLDQYLSEIMEDEEFQVEDETASLSTLIITPPKVKRRPIRTKAIKRQKSMMEESKEEEEELKDIEDSGEGEHEEEHRSQEDVVAEAIVDWDEPDDQPIIGDSTSSEKVEEASEIEMEFEFAEEESLAETAVTVMPVHEEQRTLRFRLSDYARKHKDFFEKFFIPTQRTICESDDTITMRFNINHLSGPGTDMIPPINDMYGALQGISRVRPRVTFYPEEKVLIRLDDERSKDQVKLLSGGSTGKEPLFTEYVGRGMLAAAVLGSQTDGPTIGAVVRTIKEVYNEKGVLMLVRKSAELRLIFGVALEQARIQGYDKVDMVMVGDDSYDHPGTPMGRRGLAGVALALKLAGALCLVGRTLRFIADAIRAAAFDMATISAITHPEVVIGAISQRAYEVGKKFDGSLNELVVEMLNYLIDPHKRYSLRILPDRKYVVLINSFRPHWPQLYRAADYMMTELEERRLPVSRLYAGSFVGGPCTGFSITILSDQNDHYAHLLDAPTDCVVWQKVHSPGTAKVVKIIKPDTKVYIKKGVLIKKQEAMNIRISVEEACRTMMESELLLNWIDVFNKVGTRIRGAVEAVHLLSQSGVLDYRHPFSCFLAIADTLSNNLPALMASVYGSIFVSAAEAFVVGAEVGNRWIGAMKRARKTLGALERGPVHSVVRKLVPLISNFILSLPDEKPQIIKELSCMIEHIMVEAESCAADVYSKNAKTLSAQSDQYSLVLWVDSILSVTVPGYRELRTYDHSIVTTSSSVTSDNEGKIRFSVREVDEAAYV